MAERQKIKDAHGVTLEQIDLLDLKDLRCTGYALRCPDVPGAETFSSLDAASCAWLSAVRRTASGRDFEEAEAIEDGTPDRPCNPPFSSDRTSQEADGAGGQSFWRGALIGLAAGAALVGLILFGSRHAGAQLIGDCMFAGKCSGPVARHLDVKPMHRPV